MKIPFASLVKAWLIIVTMVRVYSQPGHQEKDGRKFSIDQSASSIWRQLTNYLPGNWIFVQLNNRDCQHLAGSMDLTRTRWQLLVLQKFPACIDLLFSSFLLVLPCGWYFFCQFPSPFSIKTTSINFIRRYNLWHRDYFFKQSVFPNLLDIYL